MLWFQPQEYGWELSNELVKRLSALPLVVLAFEGTFFLARRQEKRKQAAG